MSTPLRVIRTEAAPAPVAGAPYSQAIVADPGAFVFVSGQVPVDAATGRLVADDIAVQTRPGARQRRRPCSPGRGRPSPTWSSRPSS